MGRTEDQGGAGGAGDHQGRAEDLHGSTGGLESTEAVRLENDEGVRMPATHTDISGGSAKLEANLKHLGIALVASDLMFLTPGNIGVVSIVASLMAGDSGVAALW